MLARYRLWRARIAERGWSWMCRRAWEKLSNPDDALGRLSPVVRGLAAIGSLPRSAMPTALTRARDRDRTTLYLFYDLQVEPITYNVIDALVHAELRRRELGLKDIHVVVVPGLKDGLRWEDAAYEAEVDHDTRVWRLHNVVIPVFSLLPSCRGYSLCSSRKQAKLLKERHAMHVEPLGYEVAAPFPNRRRPIMDRARAGADVLPMLESPGAAARIIRSRMDKLAQGRRLIVITLREYGFHPERNSRVDDWIRFARSLDASRYLVAFVPDTAALAEPARAAFADFPVLYDAALSPPLRMALYEHAWLNMAVIHGPTELCWYSDRCRYLFFMMADTSPQTARAVLEADGFDVGGQLPWSRPWQRWVWEPDEAAVLEARFADMEKLLETVPR